MIHNKKFEQINRVVSTFGESHFRGERIKAIYKILEEVPIDWIEEMVDSFIENSKYAPTPNDFRNSVMLLSKQKATYKHTETIYKTDCIDCYDTGFIFCKLNELEPDTLVFCHCDYGEVSEVISPKTYMPRWQVEKFDKTYGFIKLPFILENFLPKDVKEVEKFSDQFMQRVSPSLDYWKAMIHNASEYWEIKNKNAKAVI